MFYAFLFLWEDFASEDGNSDFTKINNNDNNNTNNTNTNSNIDKYNIVNSDIASVSVLAVCLCTEDENEKNGRNGKNEINKNNDKNEKKEIKEGNGEKDKSYSSSINNKPHPESEETLQDVVKKSGASFGYFVDVHPRR